MFDGINQYNNAKYITNRLPTELRYQIRNVYTEGLRDRIIFEKFYKLLGRGKIAEADMLSLNYDNVPLSANQEFFNNLKQLYNLRNAEGRGFTSQDALKLYEDYKWELYTQDPAKWWKINLPNEETEVTPTDAETSNSSSYSGSNETDDIN